MSARLRRALLMLLLCVLLPGCYAPSYMKPEDPYSPKDRSVLKQTYCYTYDTMVVLQVIPVPLVELMDWEDESLGREITMNMAMPVAVVGMVTLGTIALMGVASFVR